MFLCSISHEGRIIKSANTVISKKKTDEICNAIIYHNTFTAKKLKNMVYNQFLKRTKPMEKGMFRYYDRHDKS